MDIFQFFSDYHIAYERHDHPAVYTCEEAERLVPELPGLKTKNLFVRDKKGKQHFLVVVPDSKHVDLIALAKELGTTRLSMGSKERLWEHLRIEPGAVSLLALVNDTSKSVAPVLDEEIVRASAVLCHPLVNTSTLVMPQKGIRKFLQATGHTVRILQIPEK